LQETLAACVNVLGIKPENFMNASSLFLIISGLAGLFFGSVQTVGGWWIYQPRVTIFASDPYAAEGAGTNSPGETALFTIFRSGSTLNSLRVNLAIGGTAQNGIDYTTIPATVDVPAGRYTANVRIRVVDDALAEGTETVRLQVLAGAGYVPGFASVAKAFIFDNDRPPPAPKLGLQPDSYSSYAIDGGGRLYAWGYNSLGQLGLGDNPTNMVVPFPSGVSRWRAIAAATHHLLALDQDGRLFATGRNLDGELGVGDIPGTNLLTLIPFPPTVTRWLSVAADHNGSTAIGNDGYLYSWGAGVREPAMMTNPPGVIGWRRVVAGGTHRLALANNGQLYAWGGNFFGELGIGERTTSGTTFEINELRQVVRPSGVWFWKDVVAGTSHTLAWGSDGRLYAWGDNTHGQLGSVDLGTVQFWTVPAPVILPPGVQFWRQTAAGEMHTLLIGSDGNLYACGDNEYGQTGLGSDVGGKFTPTLVSLPAGETGWQAVAAGNLHSLAIGRSCQMYGWGYNDVGAVGIPSPGYVFFPVAVPALSNLCATSF